VCGLGGCPSKDGITQSGQDQPGVHDGNNAAAKAIGRWTAEMFLIFSLGRLDVLPVDCLGVRAAIRDLYGLDDLPDKKTCMEIAAPSVRMPPLAPGTAGGRWT
jgi:hypothetical protein